MSAAPTHLSVDVLLDYWLDDADAATTDAVDEHLMQCDFCGKVLDGLIGLGDSVRAAFRAGAVSAVTSGAFVQQLAAHGMRVREYRLPHNGSVNCTVAPEDELMVAHLEASLPGIERLDAVAQLSIEPGVQHRLEDIPFDPQNGEVLYVSKLAEVRNLPAHTMRSRCWRWRPAARGSWGDIPSTIEGGLATSRYPRGGGAVSASIDGKA